MPHLRTFRTALTGTHGAVQAAVLAARMQARYQVLYAARPRFAHLVLRWHLTSQILPGLALYQTLREWTAERGAGPEAALAEAGTVLEHLDMLARWLPLLERLPAPFAVFRRLVPPTMALFPARGWDIQMRENSRQRVAFTIRRCFYLDVLTAYGAPELTAAYCHLDDVAYAALPPCIAWQRTTTLGRGGACCDFRWCAAGNRHAKISAPSAPAVGTS